MDELSQEAVKKFWNDCPDTSIKRIIDLMESAEPWVSESPELTAHLEKLGQILASDDAAVKLNLTDYPVIIKISAALKLGRTLRLMQLIDGLNPGTATKTINYAEKHQDDTSAKILVQRNVLLERLRILHNVFATESLNHLMNFMEATDESTD